MAKPKAPISLAPVSAGKYPPVERTASDCAADAFAYRHEGPRQMARLATMTLAAYSPSGFKGPTPERLLQGVAGGARVEKFVAGVEENFVEDENGARVEKVEVQGHRVRILDDQFSRLCDRRHIDRENHVRNLALCRAGLAYRNTWEAAGQGGAVKSLNLVQERVDGGLGPGGNSAVMMQIDALSAFKAMRRAIPADFRDCLDGIVLHDKSPEDVGSRAGKCKDRTTSIRIGLLDLTRGLKHLAQYLGLIELESQDDEI